MSRLFLRYARDVQTGISDTLHLETIEKEVIQKALSQHGGNRRRAAEALGIGVRTLYRKLKEYDIE